jgi:RNA polymerase sigma factor (sigma-70 family)
MKNDDALLREFKQGNTTVYKELIKKYKPYVYTICMSLIKNREDSEEVTQDVFVKVYYSMNQFKGKSSLKTWVYKIAYNASLSLLQKKNKSFLVYDDPHSETLEDESHHHEFLFEKSDREIKIEILKRSLKELKPIETLVLTLFYLKEQSVNEIGEITSLTNSNVRVVLHRGRNNLLKKCNSKLNSK